MYILFSYALDLSFFSPCHTGDDKDAMFPMRIRIYSDRGGSAAIFCKFEGNCRSKFNATRERRYDCGGDSAPTRYIFDMFVIHRDGKPNLIRLWHFSCVGGQTAPSYTRKHCECDSTACSHDETISRRPSDTLHQFKSRRSMVNII